MYFLTTQKLKRGPISNFLCKWAHLFLVCWHLNNGKDVIPYNLDQMQFSKDGHLNNVKKMGPGNKDDK